MSFEIQYQGYLCDSWFTYQIPMAKVLSLTISKNKDLVEYIKIANSLAKDKRFKAVRVLEVEKKIVYSSPIYRS